MARGAFAGIGISKYSHMAEWLEGFSYGFLCFFMPFLLSHSSQQLLLGTIVNAAIVLAAVRLKWKHVFPAVFLPSLGVVAAGALFGSLTPFVFYMLPFIWSGNALLAFAFKRFKEKGFAVRSIAGAGAKALFLGSSALLLVTVSVLPAKLLFAMSAVQLFTALAGSILAFAVLRATRN